MKKNIIKWLIVGMSTAAPFEVAIADDVNDRLAQLEKELAELKATKAKKPSSSATKIEIGGFIKVDAMFHDYSGGVRPGNIGDEILVPSTIPIGADNESEGVRFDSHIKTSRWFFKSATNTSAGTIKSHLEFDLLSAEGDERISNSAHSRVRHAYLAWDYSETSSLLVGQTWSTFFNVGALPEAVEFIGPTSGTIFNRQNMIRWTKKLDGGSFMFALENPSTSLSDAGSGINDNDVDDNTVPDIVLRYNGSFDNLSYTAAAIGREIAYEGTTVDLNVDESEYGVGFNLSGKLAFLNGNDIKFSFSHGNLGRYIALNAFRDGGIDVDGNLDLSSVTGGYIAYKHNWTNKLRSTVQYAYSEVDFADDLPDSNTETVENANVNLMYSPTSKLSFGVAYIHATRELGTGDSGDLDRVQFSAKYSF